MVLISILDVVVVIGMFCKVVKPGINFSVVVESAILVWLLCVAAETGISCVVKPGVFCLVLHYRIACTLEAFLRLVSIAHKLLQIDVLLC